MALAVRVPPTSLPSAVDEEQEVEEADDEGEDNLDTFFSSHGFEYVDASSDSSSTTYRSPVALLQEQEIDEDGDEGAYTGMPLPLLCLSLANFVLVFMQVFPAFPVFLMH